jgi:hypothetical protein
MTDMGITLVILFPSLLFLIGTFYKALIHNSSLDKIPGKQQNKLQPELSNDYLLALGIDSIFLLIANGLIIIFQFKETEIGIILIIIGMIISIFELIGIYTKSRSIKVSGNFLIFSLVFFEVMYMFFFDVMYVSISDNINLPKTSFFAFSINLGLLYAVIIDYLSSSEVKRRHIKERMRILIPKKF